MSENFFVAGNCISSETIFLFRFHFIVKAFFQPRVYFHRISTSKTVWELINMGVISGVIAIADVMSRLLSDFA